MTPPGNGQNRQQNPGAPFQNRMCGDSDGGEHGGAASAPQYTPQTFSEFNNNMGRPGRLHVADRMVGTPGYPPGQVPYAPNLMEPTIPELGLRDAQSAAVLDATGANNIPDGIEQTKQMLLDQCVQMSILQYTGQHHQNQQQSHQQNQHQQYNL